MPMNDRRTPRTRGMARALAVTTALAGAALTGAALTGVGASVAMADQALRADGGAATGVQLAQSGQQVDFDIAAQPLADALPAFGQQAGVQVSAHGDLVRDAMTPGVQGRMSVEAALMRLLAGTSLDFRRADDGAVVLIRREAAEDGVRSLGPIMVEGAAVSDPLAGAADRAGSITVGRETLERRNPANMKDVFAGETGVSVGGGIPLSQKVYVNGVEETNLAVSIDGARQNNKVFHHNGTTVIDPALLKQARVDPGVAPADAGPGALGGSIVYETVDVDDVLAPGRSLGGFATMSFDTNGETFTNSTSAYGRSGGFEVLGFVKRADGGDYEGGDGTTVHGTSAKMLSGLAKTGYESASGHRVEFSAEQVRDNAKRPYRANMRDLTNRNDPLVRTYDLTRNNYTATYGTPDATGLWDPRAVLGYSATEVLVPTPFGSVGTTSSLSGKLENAFNLNETDSITAGADFYNDMARYEDPTVRGLEEEVDNYGLYAQARLEPLEALRLSFGVRGDYQNFEGIDGTEMNDGGLSGNGSLAYDATDFLTLRAGYSNVWGGVALAENYIFNQNWAYATDIKGVRAENYTAGFDVDHAGFTFSAGVFRSDFENARDATFGGSPADTVDFQTRGYELGAGYNWGPGFVQASYTDSKIEVNGAPGSTFNTQYRGTPLGQIIAVEVAHRFDEIGVLVGGTIDAALTNTETVDAGGAKQEMYRVYNLYTEYEPEFASFLTLRAEANNLFDEEYADRATYGQDFATVAPLLEQGRSFLFRARAEF